MLVGGTGLYAALGGAADAVMLGAAALGVIVITVVQRRRTERALDALRALLEASALSVDESPPCGEDQTFVYSGTRIGRALLHFERPAGTDLIWSFGLGAGALLWVEAARRAPLKRT